jgi:predicted anti-sigma-YlaC factor YlaD
MKVRSADCERARRFASLELDGELSRFERASLRRHLARCAACAERARSVAAVTRLLRSAPLVPFSLDERMWSHRRRSTLPAAAVAFAAVAAALAAAWFGLSSGGNAQSGFVPNSAARISVPPAGDRFDWAAGPPRGAQVVQFIPGGLYTFNDSRL